MTTTHTNLALVEGEVYILSLQPIHEKDMYFFGNRFEIKELTKYQPNVSSTEYYTEQGILKIIASTGCLSGIPQLDRKHFVKPKVDVEELAETEYKKRYGKDYFTSSEYDFQEGFKAGYNAKEAEFTRKDMEECWLQATRKAVNFNGEAGFTKFMNELRPLSLPASVTLNENNEVIEVIW